VKIGIFTETYRPTVNGVVVSIDTFKSELEKRGHEYFIFAPENPMQTKKEEGVYRFPSLYFKNQPFYPIAQPMPFTAAQKYLPIDIIRQLDIIHIQHFSMMGQYGLSYAKLLKIPSVYTYHTMAELYTGYAQVIGPLIVPPIRAWTRHTAKRADHIVVPTQSIKKYLTEIGVNQSISVIPTGIETKRYKRLPAIRVKEKYRIPQEQNILLFVGRLATEKNVDFLLKAFQKVLAAQPLTHLILAGGGPDKEKYERYVLTNNLHRNVTFTGFLPRTEIITLFGAADLFVFPSVTDTQGIVIIEAMAAGAVPVAVDRLGPHDIIKDNLSGRLTDLNLDEFSGTIVDLLQDQEKRHQLAAAAKIQAKHYDAIETANAMEKLYVKLTNSSRPK
jgi:1,2-diacylglycerol 3-alpha-glucosyltransferase